MADKHTRSQLSSKIILFRVTWITASQARVAENDLSLQRILFVSSLFFLTTIPPVQQAG
jgi:hypothetical protein